MDTERDDLARAPIDLTGEPPFVGRERERAILDAALERARTGAGGALLLSGEAGAGKSRLARELSAIARGRGIRVVWGHCEEHEGMPLYWPWPQIIGPLLCSLDPVADAALSADIAVIAQAMPEIGPTAPAPPASTVQPMSRTDAAVAPTPPRLSTPDHARFRLLECVRRLLAAASRRSSLVIVLDDLHRAGTPSLQIFQHLARAAHDMPLLLVGTFRDEGTPPNVRRVAGELAREPGVLSIELRGLERREVRRFIELTVGARAADALSADLHERTGGNPFFLTELMRTLPREGDAGVARALAPPARLPVPGAVREMLLRRTERLSSSCLRVLEAAAVLGRDVDLSLLRALLVAQPAPRSGEDADQESATPNRSHRDDSAAECVVTDAALLDALDEAERAGMVRREDGEAQYRFVHALIREVIYDFLPPSRRARLHRAVVAALVRVHRHTPEPVLSLIAHHARHAVPIGDALDAVRWLRRAAAAAGERLAHEEAVDACGHALDLLARWQPGEIEPRRALLLTLGDAQRRSGDLDAALATFVRAAAAAREGSSDAVALARAALGYEDAFLPTARPRAGAEDRSIQLLQSAAAVLPAHETILTARVTTALARARFFAGTSASDAIALSDQAVEMARESGDAAALAHALSTRRMLAWGPDDLHQRLGLASDLVLAATAAGDRELTQEGRSWRIRALLEAGDLQAALPEIAAYRQTADALRQPLILTFAALMDGIRPVLDGRWAEAESVILEARAIEARFQGREMEGGIAARLFTVYRETGQRQQLAALVPTIRSFADDYPLLPGWRAMLTLALLDLGRDQEARIEFERLAVGGFAAMPRDWLWLTAMAYLAEGCVRLGDRSHAAVLYDLLLPYAAYNPVAVDCLGSCARFLGMLAAGAGNSDAARAHYEAALTADLRLGARPWLAHSLFAYARLLLEQADDASERIHALLARAAAIATESGMAPLLSRIASLRERFPVRRVPGESSDDGRSMTPDRPAVALTPREREVLSLIAAGKSNPEIAAALTISPHTAVRHVSNILAKIDAATRAEAAAYAVRAGLLR